ncbi:hypothetical protein BR93DRAFT_930522 [Coniochaeta sp. PMI_546]|nr:hypothetical protein BR93DRAFT_930522 [Coniochaeta sp. PMI_546]
MDTPVCQASLQWLFNTYRRPQIGMDEMNKAAGDYCVVFRRGRLFRLPLHDGEAPASFDTVRSAMTAIVEHVQDEGTWAGILTSDNRDSWAKVSFSSTQGGSPVTRPLSIPRPSITNNKELTI